MGKMTIVPFHRLKQTYMLFVNDIDAAETGEF